MNKELKSLTIQMAMFYLVPSIYVIVLLFLLFTGVLNPMRDMWIQVPSAVATILIIIGAFLMAYNTVGFRYVGPPSVDVYDITIASNRISTTRSRGYSEGQQAVMILNLIVAAICLLLVAFLGWLFFILYLKNMFLMKVKTMAINTDIAEDRIASRCNDMSKLSESFYYMLEYVDIYQTSGDKGAGNKMLKRAEKLYELMKAAS